MVLMYTLLVTQIVACLVSASELALISMCTLLVIQTVACLVSVGEMSFVLNVDSFGDTGLSCFRM